MISLSQEYIVYGGIIIFAVFFLLIVFLIRQQQQIRQMQQPKYGFLGKPILGAIATLVLLTSVVVGSNMLNTRQPDTNFTGGNFDSSISVNKEFIASNLDTASYKFSVKPIINGKEYGVEGTNYDIYWTFIGPVNYSENEINRSKTNPGGITVTLNKGTYKLYVLVMVGQATYNYSEDILI